MDSRLIFRGYVSQDLDAVDQLFRNRTGLPPAFFAIRPGWEVSGSEENMAKVVQSTLVGATSIYVPLFLNLKQFLAIESEREELRSHSQSVEPERVPKAFEDIKPEKIILRHCSYCGATFEVDPINITQYCGKIECKEKHIAFQRETEESRQYARTRIDQSLDRVKREIQQPPMPKEIDNFSLDSHEATSDYGWVYFIQAENNLVKIGRSDDLKKRFDNLVSISPVHLCLVHTIAATNYVKAEGRMHEHFADKRHHGEWFALTDEDLDWAKRQMDYDLD